MILTLSYSSFLLCLKLSIIEVTNGSKVRGCGKTNNRGIPSRRLAHRKYDLVFQEAQPRVHTRWFWGWHSKIELEQNVCKIDTCLRAYIYGRIGLSERRAICVKKWWVREACKDKLHRSSRETICWMIYTGIKLNVNNNGHVWIELRSLKLVFHLYTWLFWLKLSVYWSKLLFYWNY